MGILKMHILQSLLFHKSLLSSNNGETKPIAIVITPNINKKLALKIPALFLEKT